MTDLAGSGCPTAVIAFLLLARSSSRRQSPTPRHRIYTDDHPGMLAGLVLAALGYLGSRRAGSGRRDRGSAAGDDDVIAGFLVWPAHGRLLCRAPIGGDVKLLAMWGAWSVSKNQCCSGRFIGGCAGLVVDLEGGLVQLVKSSATRRGRRDTRHCCVRRLKSESTCCRFS
jgi:hypothetical protein